MIKRVVLLGVLVASVALPIVGYAAERECDRWLKLVDGEVRERKEAVEKKSGVERERLKEAITKTAPKIAEARKACGSGEDKVATLMALELWDGFVDAERQEGSLSLTSRLNVLALRIDRFKAFQQKGWKPQMSPEAQRALLAELDKFDRVLADSLKRALR